MGAFLFYLFKSTLCLAMLYLLFRLCFRGDTLFRTNRFLLLGGTAGCLLLPLVQVDVPQESLWQRPLVAVEAALTKPSVEEVLAEGTLSEADADLLRLAEAGGLTKSPWSETSTGGLYLLAALYAGGVVLTLGFFLLSHGRMRQLVCRCPVRDSHSGRCGHPVEFRPGAWNLCRSSGKKSQGRVGSHHQNDSRQCRGVCRVQEAVLMLPGT